MELAKKVTIWLMLFIGLGCCILGFGIGGVEIYHVLHGNHIFGYPPFVGAGIFIIGGASLVQTGSVKLALADLVEVTPILRSTLVNRRRNSTGVRKTDIVIDDKREKL